MLHRTTPYDGVAGVTTIKAVADTVIPFLTDATILAAITKTNAAGSTSWADRLIVTVEAGDGIRIAHNADPDQTSLGHWFAAGQGFILESADAIRTARVIAKTNASASRICITPFFVKNVD